MSGALLEVHDLKTFFYRRGRFGVLRTDDYVAAVDGVDVSVGEGETLGIVGESGCGKTTLGRTILRLLPATSGSVRYRGEEILRLSAAAVRAKRREMQMIFQDLGAALNPKMRIYRRFHPRRRLRRGREGGGRSLHPHSTPPPRTRECGWRDS